VTPAAITVVREAGLVPASEVLTAAEAQAVVADFLRDDGDTTRAERYPTRSCRCAAAWEFERRHCCRCGHDIGARSTSGGRA
jgi:hypothetical protein